MASFSAVLAVFGAVLGCVLGQSIPPCVPVGAPLDVTISEDTAVCVVLNNRTQAFFTPTADDFTRLQINGCECVCVGV